MSAGLGGVGDRKSGLVLAIVSLAFVLLWSTGHIATKLGDPYIEPFKFLAIRFSLSTIVLVPIVLVIGGRWPRSITAARHIAIAGLLIHAGYLGGVFVAIDLGLSAGALAVITGLQPLLTGIVAASAFGESVTRRQWSGLVLGLGGVALVVWEKAVFEGTPRLAFVAAFLCLISITCGAIYQKRFCPDENIPAMTAIQLCLSAVTCSAVSLTIETGAVDWTGELIIAIGWQVIFLSAVATTLLYWLLRQGETTRMTGLFYLMAPTTALMGWFMFGETFGPLGAAGLLVAVAGFWLVFRRRAV